jgi:hypothetical protein
MTRTTALALSLLALTACAADDQAPDVDVETDGTNGLTSAQIAELGQPASPEVNAAHARDFAARMRVQADRAQVHLDAHVIPDFDRALRATANVSYATLQAEVAEAVQLTDPDARKARLDRFFAEHGDAIDAALARMGTTATQLADDVRAAATAGDVEALAEVAPKTRAACGTGLELQPFPPYAEAGQFTNGTPITNAFGNVNGSLSASSSQVAGWGQGVAWVRSDNLPPVGNGVTVVTVSASFRTDISLILWVPAYSGAGTGLTVEMFADGPQGPRIGSCRLPVMDRSIPIGFLEAHVTQPITFQCVLRHGPTPFLTTKVLVDAYAAHNAPWGGGNASSATATISSIRHFTCLD